jgi:hypothetical protein
MNLRPLVLAAALALVPATARAQQPFQLSLFNPAQIVGEGQSVSGVRLNVIYTKNASVEFVDLGFGFNHTTGNQTGIMWALIGNVEGNFTGWQNNLVAITDKRFTGLQMGAFTSNNTGQGVQFGWVNVSKGWNGLQLGLVNIADRMVNGGLQIGLVNIIKSGGVAPVLPIVNFTF